MVNADKFTSVYFSDSSMSDSHNFSHYESDSEDSNEKTSTSVETKCDSE